MLYLIAKAAVSGIIVALASEVARRSSMWGALILSLPLVSILAMIWLWRDTGDSERIAGLARGTFWLVLPTLPFFLVLPVLLRQGMPFWPALGTACLVTVVLYLLVVWLLPKLGVSL
jgi:F0F1-type ATP synthase assembly protein I